LKVETQAITRRSREKLRTTELGYIQCSAYTAKQFKARKILLMFTKTVPVFFYTEGQTHYMTIP